jgi:choline kinase
LVQEGTGQVKAIILAAGMGSRLGKYTRDRPKCLLKIGKSTILERQVELLHQFGINDIVIVKGYAAHKINMQGIRYYINEHYASTNMVFSLFCAEPEIEGEVIISYADILFDSQVLNALLQAPSHDIAVVVDELWEEYYRERFEEPFKEAESLICDTDGRILEIGQSCPEPSDTQAQYIGLVKLSDNGSKIFRQVYNHAKIKYWDKIWQRGRIFQKVYMTDFLQALIDAGNPVYAVSIQHGWLEFDNETDYENVLEWFDQDVLDRFFSLKL